MATLTDLSRLTLWSSRVIKVLADHVPIKDIYMYRFFIFVGLALILSSVSCKTTKVTTVEQVRWRRPTHLWTKTEGWIIITR